ncbi:MAG: ABC transporter ATP-binding protein [Lachnospiraceae bacterium]|nr:ABC transporter ATP-binding protein [Lachnospiraceae bacterium]
MVHPHSVELKHITKTFGSVVANDDVSMNIREGEILSLLGENGSGKTSLMNMIAGIYYPDAGEIKVHGKVAEIRSPKDAFDLGIGMIHQHFKLVDVFTATENIALGLNESEKFDLKEVRKKAEEICKTYEFDLDLDQKVYSMSVSQKQTLEIVKVLYRGASLLILDEPTAVLTLQEIKKLFNVIRAMKKNGKSVVIITHKLNEVMEISDRVAVLRKGKYIGTIHTYEASESLLTEMMVGQKVELNIDRPTPKNIVKRLEIKHLNVKNIYGLEVLKDINFDAYGGEILGIAGVSGNGQKELLEAIAGLQVTEPGASITYYPQNSDDKMEIIGKTPKAIRNAGVHLSFVPEDRLGMGLVGSMGMSDNMMLKSYENGHSIFLDRKAPKELANEIKDELGVVTPGLQTPVSRLSGGNVQKVLVGREIALSPTVLMTAYAVRGLDINTSYTIYHLLNEQKEKGVAVIYVGEDLDVLLALCDRIMVLCGGQVNGILDGRTATKEEVGRLMTSHVTNLEETAGEDDVDSEIYQTEPSKAAAEEVKANE